MEMVPSDAGASAHGGVLKPPCAYGNYETGRSSRPLWQKPWGSAGVAAFKDSMPMDDRHPQRHPPQGDPGMYEPYKYEDAGTNPEHNSSASRDTRKPFDSTEVRELRSTLFGLETPSVGHYPICRPEETIGSLDDKVRYPLLDANVSVFRSGSPQRPVSSSFVPSPAAYSPNVYSIMPAPNNPGASMKGQGDRSWLAQAQFKSQTDEIVGPGTYEGAELDQTLMQDCRDAMKRSSKIVKSFATTSPQRPGFFYNPGQSPDVAPGCYEPLEPRLKDLKAQGGDAWRQVM